MKLFTMTLLLAVLLATACVQQIPAKVPATATSTPIEVVKDESLPQTGDTAVSCPEATANLQRLTNPRHGYCLLYPAEYKVEKPNNNETVLVIGGLLNAGDPRVHIVVEPAGDQSAQAVADQLAADFPAEVDIQRSSMTVGGETAEVVDLLPGQDVNRRVIFAHNGLLYKLMFSPVLNNDNEPYARMETFYTQILDSFTFVPQSDAVIEECLEATAETQLLKNEKHGYCLLVPNNYKTEQPNENETVFFVGSLLDVAHPKLFIVVQDAGGLTPGEAADELMASFPSDFGIERSFGLTIGYKPAEQLDNVPGQDISRVVLVEHDGRLYKLTFVPASEDAGEVFTQMEALFDLVVRSFRFLPYSVLGELIADGSRPYRLETPGTGVSAGVTQYGVSFQYDPYLATDIQAEVVTAFTDEQAGGFTQLVIPDHLVFTFLTSYADEQTLYRQAANLNAEPHIAVYPAGAYAAMNLLAKEQIEGLQTLLAERPADPGGELPFLPTVNASRALHIQLVYLEFANGAGVRYLTQVAQETRPVNNQELFYTFQGLTDDGAYYVAAFFPVTTSILPDTPKVADDDAFNANFSTYLRETTAALNQLSPADFMPDLTLLDAVITSLRVEPDVELRRGETAMSAAETTSPLVTPPPGLVYRTPADGLWRVDASDQFCQCYSLVTIHEEQQAGD